MSEREVFDIEFIVNSNMTRFQKDIAQSAVSLGALHEQMKKQFRGEASRLMENEVNRTFRGLREKGVVSGLLSANADFMQFGKNLEKSGSNIKRLKDGMREYRDALDKAATSMGRLAAHQVKMEQSGFQVVNKMTRDGMLQGRVIRASEMEKTAEAARSYEQHLRNIRNTSLSKINTDIINSGKNMQWTGRQLMVGLSLPVAALGYLAVKSFREVDTEMTRLAKVYGDSTLQGQALLNQTKKIREESLKMAREMAGAYGQKGQETIGLMADLAATGQQGQQLMESTRATTKLMILGEVERQDAMKTTLTLQNAFNVSTKQTGEAVNFLNAVENQTSLSLQDMTEAMPRAGTVVQALGGDYKDLALMMTAMKEGGVDAAEAANAIKSSLGRVINAPKAAKEQLKMFGIDLDSIVKDNEGDLKGLIFSLQDAINRNVPQENRASVFEKLFGKWQFAKMLALFDNLRQSGSQTNEVLRLMGASTAELAIIAENELGTKAESATVKFERALETVKLQLVELGEPVMNLVSTLLNGINMIMQGFNAMPDVMKKLVIGGVIIGALVGPIVMVTGLLKNFYGILRNVVLWTKNFGETGKMSFDKTFKVTTDQDVANKKLADSTLAMSNSMQRAATNAHTYAKAMMELQTRLIAIQTVFSKGNIGGIDTASFQTTDLLTLARNEENKKQFQVLMNKFDQEVKANARVIVDKMAANAPLRSGSYSIRAGELPGERGHSVQFLKSKEEYVGKTFDAAAKSTEALGKANVQAEKNTMSYARTIGQRAKDLASSRGGVAGGGMFAAMMAQMIPTESLGGGGGIAKSAITGLSLGAQTMNPWIAAAGAGLGVLYGAYDKAKTSQDNFARSSMFSEEAARLMGVTLNDLSQAKLKEFAKTMDISSESLEKFQQAVKDFKEGSVEKALMETIKNAPTEKAKVDAALEYYKAQIMTKPKELWPEVQTLINAMFTELGQDWVIPKLDIAIKDLSIANKEQAQDKFMKQVDEMFAEVGNINKAESKYVTGNLGIGGSKMGGGAEAQDIKATTKMVDGLVGAMQALPADEFISMLDRMAKSGKSLNDVNVDSLIESLNNLPDGKGTSLAESLDLVKTNGADANAIFAIASAKIQGLSLDYEDLTQNASNYDYVMQKITESQQRATRANEIMSAMAKSLKAADTAGSSNSFGAVAVKNLEKNAKAATAQLKQLERAAKKAQSSSRQYIDRLNREFKSVEESFREKIDSVREKYDSEIESVRRRYDAEREAIDATERKRQEAFDAEQKRKERASQYRGMEIDYLKALHTGSYFEASKIKGDLAGLKDQHASEDAEEARRKKFEEDAERARKLQEESIKRLEDIRNAAIKSLEEQLEAARKAHEEQVANAEANAQAQERMYQRKINAARKAEEVAKAAAQGSKQAGISAAEETKSITDKVIDTMQKHLAKTPGDIAGAIVAGAKTLQDAGGNAKGFVKWGFDNAGIPGLGEDVIGEMKGNMLNYPWELLGHYAKAKMLGDEAEANMLRSVIESVVLLNNMSSGGGKKKKNKKAFGGLVTGEGTGMSDDVMLWASNGEYVIRESVVRQLGVPFFNALNTGSANYASRNIKANSDTGISASASRTSPSIPGVTYTDFGQFLSNINSWNGISLGGGGTDIRPIKDIGSIDIGDISQPIDRDPLYYKPGIIKPMAEKSTAPAVNIYFGRTSATRADIEDTMVRVIEQKTARLGRV